MLTILHQTPSLMKNLKQIFAALLLSCCMLAANAQCGVHAGWSYTVNPNHVHVFTDTSTATGGYQITNHYWSFGDGSTSSLTNPTHAYNTPGHYTVCEYVIGTANGGAVTCIDTFCHEVSNCDGMVQATISANVNVSQVVFTGTASSNYPPIHYSWTFPGGTPSVSTTPTTTVMYPQPGNHQACLTATDTNGCSATVCQTVATTSTACGNMDANIFVTETTNSVTITSTSTGTNTNTLYQYFVDAASTTPGPNTSYTAGNLALGHHHVCLYLYGQPNVVCDSTCKNVYLQSNSCTGVIGYFGSTVTGTSALFDAHSYQSDNSTLYQWQIDNQTVTTPVHDSVYSATNLSPGTHTVCLYVYGAVNAVCDTVCQTFTVTGCGVNTNFQNQVNGNVVTFYPAANVGPINSYWSFGDGNTVSDTATYVMHTYPTSATAQTYHACHYVYIPGTNCVDSTCETITIPATSANCGQGVFSYTTGSGYTVFTGTSTVNTNTFSWVVRNSNTGTVVLNTTGNPVTLGNVANGNYQVCMSLYSSNHTLCDSICQTVSITNNNPCTGLSAQFTQTMQNNHSYNFISSNQVAAANYHWDFGDGHSATTPDPNHGYDHPGLYTVCLIVNVPGTNCADTSCHYVQADSVTNCANAIVTIGSSTTPNGVTTLTAVANGTPAIYVWSNAATTQTITVTSPGTYCVSVSYNNACTASACYTVTSSGCGHASFTTTIVNGSIHAQSTSTGLSLTPHYYWNLWGPNGTLIQTLSGTSSLFESQVVPAGTYRVCLFLYGNNTQVLCDSTCETVTITSGNPCTGLSANFTYTYSTSGGVHFYGVNNSNTVINHWSFGDGSTSTNFDPTHYYTTAGLYTICHYVEVPGSICSDSSCITIQVTAGNPCSNFGVNINSSNTPNTLGSLEAIPYGGTPPYAYAWNNASTTQAIHPTSNGVYCVTVYDNNQCSAAACDTFHTTTTPCHAEYSYHYVTCNTVQFTNVSTGGYTNLIWTFGDGTSSSAANPVHTFPTGTWTVQLTVYSSGTNCQNTYYQVITSQPCGINDTICGVVFNDLNGNGVRDNGEPAIAGGTIYAGNYHVTVGTNGEYHIILPAGSYTLYYCAPSGYSFTIPVGSQNPNSNTINTCASYTIVTSGGSHCGYNFGLQNNSTTICGTVYLDANNNHQQDSAETGIPNVHVMLTGDNGTIIHAYTDQNGHYCATVPAGTYTVQVDSNLGGTVTPGSISVTTVNGTNYYHTDFGVYIQPGSCNLAINIIPHTTVTPGYPAWYDLEVCNVGASVSTGTVSLFFDPALDFSSASPAQTSANNSTHTVTWALSNLTPGSCMHYWVDFDAHTNLTPGQHVFMLANVTTSNCNETDFTNNVDTVHQEVTASWDPNNKLVLPAGIGSEGLIKGDEDLTYTVNFQNTGNAPAINIVVHDVLDDNLDMETFRMLGASHAYTMQFAGREVIWKFNSIMLPDSNINEPASHGYAAFAIKPKTGLPKGTRITNTADIYFDYNAPVSTNTTVNTIDYNLSVNDFGSNKATITLMPNPFKDFTTIKIDGETGTYQLKMFDMLGQLVHTDVATNNVFSIQRENLAAGVYMYQITKQGKQIGQGKMIAE